MIVIRYILLTLEAIVSLMLILIILVQQSKSQGLGMAFGSGGMGESLFGSRAGNVLTKATVTLTVIFVLNTLVLGVLFSGGQRTSLMAEATGSAPMQQPATQQQQPMMPAAATVPNAPMDAAPAAE